MKMKYFQQVGASATVKIASVDVSIDLKKKYSCINFKQNFI